MKVTIILFLILVGYLSSSCTDAWKYQIKKESEYKNKLSKIIKYSKNTVLEILGTKKPGKNGQPWFCHELDCPIYKLVNKTDDYEERCYPETTWVMTSMQGKHRGKTRKYTIFNEYVIFLIIFY